jgi:hypothetical protein
MKKKLLEIYFNFRACRRALGNIARHRTYPFWLTQSQGLESLQVPGCLMVMHPVQYSDRECSSVLASMNCPHRH